MDQGFLAVIKVKRIPVKRFMQVFGKEPNSWKPHWAGPDLAGFEDFPCEGNGFQEPLHQPIVFHADPLVLIYWRDGRTRRQKRDGVRPPLSPKLFVRWYCAEMDEIRMEIVPSWAMAGALAPEHWKALTSALIIERERFRPKKEDRPHGASDLLWARRTSQKIEARKEAA